MLVVGLTDLGKYDVARKLCFYATYLALPFPSPPFQNSLSSRTRPATITNSLQARPFLRCWRLNAYGCSFGGKPLSRCGSRILPIAVRRVYLPSIDEPCAYFLTCWKRSYRYRQNQKMTYSEICNAVEPRSFTFTGSISRHHGGCTGDTSSNSN